MPVLILFGAFIVTWFTLVFLSRNKITSSLLRILGSLVLSLGIVVGSSYVFVSARDNYNALVASDAGFDSYFEYQKALAKGFGSKEKLERFEAAERARELEEKISAILGKWRIVLTNPKYRNSVADRYERHTFLKNGFVEVEKEEGTRQRRWTVKGNVYVAYFESNNSVFEEHFRLTAKDTLIKTRFVRYSDGAITIDKKQSDKYVRQGSDLELRMTKVDIFGQMEQAKEFIDPNELVVGARYLLSDETNLMPEHSPKDPWKSLESMMPLVQGNSIEIVSIAKLNNRVWYEVYAFNASGYIDRGWINSFGLYGQSLELLD